MVMELDFGAIQAHVPKLHLFGSSLPDALGHVVPRVLLEKVLKRIDELEAHNKLLQNRHVMLQGWWDASFKSGLAPAAELEKAQSRLQGYEKEYDALLANYSKMSTTWMEQKKKDDTRIESLIAALAAEKARYRPLFSRRHSTFCGVGKAMRSPSCVAVLKGGSTLSVHSSKYDDGCEEMKPDDFFEAMAHTMQLPSSSMLEVDDYRRLEGDDIQAVYDETEESAEGMQTPKKQAIDAPWYVYVSPHKPEQVDDHIKRQVPCHLQKVADTLNVTIRRPRYLKVRNDFHFAAGLQVDTYAAAEGYLQACNEEENLTRCGTICFDQKHSSTLKIKRVDTT